MHIDRVHAQDDSTDEETVVREARDRLQECVEAWGENHTQAEHDIEMRSGDQWDADVVNQRQQDQRPTLTFNRLETYVQQVVGNQRQNRPGIHVAPADLDMEDKIPGEETDEQGQSQEYRTSDVLEGLVRQIEYKSRAGAAYDTAFDHAVGNGFGYFRLVTDYANDTSFEQEVRIKRIRNPFAVYMDPAAETLTYEDATYAFISDWLSEDEFSNLYPDAEASEDLPEGTGQDRALWWVDGKVRVVEYFRKVPREKTIALVQGPDGSQQTVNLGESKKEIDAARKQITDVGAIIARERQVKHHKVVWYLLNGSTVLEGPKEFPSKYIPVIPVWGREIIDDGETVYQSLIRHALDAQKNYNYWRSAMTELVALAPKSPWVGPARAFQGYEQYWRSANTKNWPFLPYNDESPAPPQRPQRSDLPQGATQEAQSADYDMKATIGMFEASLGERSNERSGRAIEARQNEGDVGTYIFTDNLNKAIEHCGRVMLDMIPRVYDTPRTLRIRREGGEGDFVRVNQDTPEGRMGDITRGQFDVTVKAGPSYATQREEFVQSLWEASRANPQLWQVAGDLLIKNMDWPGAEEIAQRIKRTIPPQVLTDDPSQIPQPEPTPEQQADMAKYEAQAAQAEANKVKAQADIEREGMKTEQEFQQTEQDAYEKQTEVMQMLTRLAELEDKLDQQDTQAQVQNAVSDAILELNRQGLLQPPQQETEQQ